MTSNSSRDKTAMAVSVFDKAAQTYQEKYMDVTAYAESLDLFCESLMAKAKVLELACGPGNVTQYLLNKRADLEVLATDLAPAMLDLAKLNVPTANFELLDCRAIGQLTDSYNGIICAFGFPYLSKQEALQFIADAALLLLEGGLLYISTMEDDYSNSKWMRSKTENTEELFMHYHEAKYLISALESSGFQLLHVGLVPLPIPDGNIQDLVLVAQKVT